MKVSAIIPALNEEKTIFDVLNVLNKTKIVDEVIVVNDGSSDSTASIAKTTGSHVINLPCNLGKGAAVKKGLEICSGDIVLLLDADLIGLEKDHVFQLLKPVLDDKVDMTVGVFNFGRISTDLAHVVSPFLSGQRAMKKSILDNVPGMEITGYGVEVALTRYASKNSLTSQKVVLNNLTHVMKEEKLGLVKGVSERMKMYWHIYKGLKTRK